MLQKFLKYPAIIKYCTIIGITFLYLPVTNAQVWSIRPELMITSAKGNEISNTAPFSPSKAKYYNAPDVLVMVDRYLKPHSKISLGIGTFSSGFALGFPAAKGNGLFGFLFPDSWSVRSVNMGGQILTSYAVNVLSKRNASKLWLGAGANVWFFPKANATDSSNGGWAYNKQKTSLVNSTQFGLHGSLHYQIGNKKQREVFQFFARYNIGFKKTNYQMELWYDAIEPGTGQNFTNQYMVYGLNCTNIQVGISKTLKYFPAQRKPKPLHQ